MQDIPTRWNSNFLLLRNLNENRAALAMHADEVDVQVPTQCRILLQKTIVIMGPQLNNLRETCQQKTSTSLIIPGYHKLRKFMMEMNDKNVNDP